MYDPNQELDPITLETWSRMSVSELENLRDNLMKRIDEMTQFSEGLHNDGGQSLEKLEKYIMYRKGSNNNNNTMIL